ncbi:hypothetical protein MAPG_11713 [Magnaporthiopsis poae ATCC 64411]|uniref:Uncharacterized protein n=1 Tax=Magnaporthiopsis poae (strain ATCC 64411 / 73-15) TaxID=644358 RepID=A0A0C4EG01_MAGP6|nr:hypothetical protein MAPG_11713 [Magnaporthiopsis poae ATCC 64411]
MGYLQLLIVPVRLTAGFVALVVVLSLRDVNPGLLYSQCHARARLPWLSHAPLLGAPVHYLVSFFHKALASTRSAASLAEVPAFVGGLLTVATLEAARLCNASSALIAHPTGPWLVFNPTGGEPVWVFVIVPAFLRRAKGLIPVDESPDARLAADSRNLAFAADAVVVPLSAALGFVAPSAAMLATNSPITILGLALLPPSTLRSPATSRAGPSYAPCPSVPRPASASRRGAGPSWTSMAGPVVCSIAAHLWNLVVLIRGADGWREITRSTVEFIEIDAVFIGLTVLYWILVEGGWRLAGLMVLLSVLLGPGAGICAAWVCREWTAHAAGFVEKSGSVGPERTRGADEETPLLRYSSMQHRWDLNIGWVWREEPAFLVVFQHLSRLYAFL